jgi:hypothetical protein
MRKFGGNLMIGAIVFGLAQTIYFGFNWIPKTTAEWVCDGITVAMLVIGSSIYNRHKGD